MRREKKELLGKVRLSKNINFLIKKLANPYEYERERIYLDKKEYIKKATTLKKFNQILDAVVKRKAKKTVKTVKTVKFEDKKTKLKKLRAKREMALSSYMYGEPKVKNNTHYDTAKATTDISRNYNICSYSTPYSGKWSNKSYKTYYYLIHCAFSVSPMGKSCTFYLEDKEYTYKAVKGFRFADKSGICIENIKNNDIDYHFDSGDFFNAKRKPKLSDFVKKAKENYKQRKRFEKERILKEKIEKKYKKFIDKNDPFVFIKDSLNFGNCGVGTRKFIKRYNIEKKYIKGSILKKLDSYNDRVTGAIEKANEREYQELQVGYCNI